MENNIKKFGQFVNESTDASTDIFDFISEHGFDVTRDYVTKEEVENILIDISDLVDDEKYHWAEVELKKITK